MAPKPLTLDSMTGLLSSSNTPHIKQRSTSLTNTGTGNGVVSSYRSTLNGLKNERFVACSQFVARPSFGSIGRSILVSSNHFSIDVNHKKVIYRYDIAIECLPQAFKLSASGDERRRFSKISESMCRAVIDKAIKDNASYGHLFHNIVPVYDGSKTMFTCGPVIGIAMDGKPTRLVVEVCDNSDCKQFAVYMRFTGNTISLHALKLYFDKKTNAIPFEAIQALNIVVRQGLVATKILIGSSLFLRHFEDPNRISMSGGKQLAFGFYQSVRPCIGGAQLVVDRCCTAFYEQFTIEEFVCKMFPYKDAMMRFKWTDCERKRIEKELKSLQIEVRHLKFNKKYKIKALTRDSASDVMFEWTKQSHNGSHSDRRAHKRGEKQSQHNQQSQQSQQTTPHTQHSTTTISVAQYFQQQYGLPLLYPHLPCVVVCGSNSQKPTYFPIEVCRLVADQHVSHLRQKLSPQQTAEMIRIAASTTPSQRFSQICSAVVEMSGLSLTSVVSNNCLKHLHEFGMKVSAQPISLTARVVSAPQLIESAGKQCVVKDGKWRINQFYSSARMSKWIIVNMASIDDNAITNFIDTLIKYGIQLGMNDMCEPICRVKMCYQRGQLKEKLFDRAIQKYGTNIDLFVFCGIESDDCYYEIKRCGDIEMSISTQCVKKHNVLRVNQSLATNLLLKINTKLGGENISGHNIISNIISNISGNIISSNAIIIGADVAHPSPSDKLCASVAAVVGNVDTNFVKNYAAVKVQFRYREEIINDLDVLVNEILVEYRQHNGSLPTQIVFYRDGVSEGQFMYVMDFEVRKMKIAFQSLEKGYNPKLTFIVVQKRHHTRFIPDDQRDGVGRAKNIPPGTVVDNVVVHPTDFDFYLCSHEAIQGTARPAHYYVLYDDNHFGADQLQAFTYAMCHTYARCTRSVSIPSPVYYAHLAAHRARGLINSNSDSSSDSSASGNSGSGGNSGYGNVGCAPNPTEFRSGSSPNLRLSKRLVPNLENLSDRITLKAERKSSMYFC